MCRPEIDTCPHCGLNYDKFRTPYVYDDIFDMLWVKSSDPANWVYKRKGTILRLFNKIKLSLWKEHLDNCEHHALGLDSGNYAEVSDDDYAFACEY